MERFLSHQTSIIPHWNQERAELQNRRWFVYPWIWLSDLTINYPKITINSVANYHGRVNANRQKTYINPRFASWKLWTLFYTTYMIWKNNAQKRDIKNYPYVTEFQKTPLHRLHSAATGTHEYLYRTHARTGLSQALLPSL